MLLGAPVVPWPGAHPILSSGQETEFVSATSDFHSEVPNERIKTTAAMSLYNSHSTLNTIIIKTLSISRNLPVRTYSPKHFWDKIISQNGSPSNVTRARDRKTSTCLELSA